MNLFSNILDGIYPRCCPVCHDIVLPRGELICSACLSRLQPITQPRCMKCGKKLTDPTAEYCGDCRRVTHHFDQGMGIYPYDRRMQKSIEKYKFHGRREYGDFYVQAMLHYGEAHIRRWKPDCIVPIPLTDAKRRIRGFNQSEYLARGLGEALGIPVKSRVLLRNAGAREQKKLDARERRKNLRNVFCLGPEYARWESVLLVDDVYTTGSTIDAAAKLLKENGTRWVWFLTVCQGKGF